MKKMILMAMMMVMTVTANAMSYEQAREQALFLTDKMAYELNLTEDQYEAAYEINLDYLMSINSYDDLYGLYWERRNMDLSYILLDWQYRAYCAANYFYRPLYWDAGYWHFGIYARYPHRTYFYFGRPHFYLTYRGGHSWHMNGGRSWYHGRSWGVAHRNSTGGRGFGMRNGFDRGDFRNGRTVGGSHGRSNGINSRDSRSRSNGINTRGNDNRRIENRSGSFGGSRSGSTLGGSRSSSMGSNRNGVRESSTRATTAPSRSSFSGSRSSSSSSHATPSRSFSPSRSSSSSSHSAPGRSVSSGRSSGSSSFSGGRSSSMGSRSSGSSMGSRSSGSSMGTRSSGGSSSSGRSGGSHGNFGGRR